MKHNIRAEQGSVTAEYAVLLPIIVLFLALILGTAGLGVERIRVEDAARVSARMMARGDGAPAVHAAVQQITGKPAAVSQSGAADMIGVTVTVASGIPVLGWVLPDHSVTAYVAAESVQLP